jgi:hypothetical protein
MPRSTGTASPQDAVAAEMQAKLVLAWLRREYLDGRVSMTALPLVASELEQAALRLQAKQQGAI